LEQNREVFAIPHRIDAPQGQGCNVLIQQAGAKLVTRLDDILTELGIRVETEPSAQQAVLPLKVVGQQWKSAGLQGQALAICQGVSEGLSAVDTLSETLGLPVSQLLPQLLELELTGLLKNLPGKRVELL